MINKYTNKQRGLLAVIMAMVMVFAGAAFVAAEVDGDGEKVLQIATTEALLDAVESQDGSEYTKWLLTGSEYDISSIIETGMVITQEGLTIEGSDSEMKALIFGGCASEVGQYETIIISADNVTLKNLKIMANIGYYEIDDKNYYENGLAIYQINDIQNTTIENVDVVYNNKADTSDMIEDVAVHPYAGAIYIDGSTAKLTDINLYKGYINVQNGSSVEYDDVNVIIDSSIAGCVFDYNGNDAENQVCFILESDYESTWLMTESLQNYIIKLNGNELTIPKGDTLTATIESSDGSVVTFNGLIASNDVTISEGSIVIIGSSSAGTVNVTEGTYKVVGDMTCNITVAEGAKLVISEGATVTGTVTNAGTVDIAGTIEGDVTNNGTISFLSEDAEITGTSTGTGKIDTSAVAEEGTISGSFDTSTTFGKNQMITATGDITLVKGTVFVFEGSFIIPEGVTVTIQSGAQLIMYGQAANLENDGTIVIESYVESNVVGVQKGGFVINGGTATNNGTISLVYETETPMIALNIWDGVFINDGSIEVSEQSKLRIGGTAKVTNNGNITVDSEAQLQASSKVLNKGTVDVEGLVIGATSFENYGEITLAGKMGGNVTIDTASVDAVLNINGIIADNIYTITVTEVALDAALVADKKDVAEDTESQIVLTIGDEDSVSGLSIAAVVDKVVDAGTTTYYTILTMSGDVIADDETEEPAGSETYAVGIATAGDVSIAGDLILNGIDLSVGGVFTVPGTLTVINDKNNSTGTGTITLLDASKTTITGTVSTTEKGVTDNSGAQGEFNAVAYTVKATTSTPVTYYYTTLANAIASGTDKATVYGEATVEEDLTVPGIMTVEYTAGALIVIDSDATMTLAAGAVVKSAADDSFVVEGTLVIEDVKKSKVKDVNVDSDVKSAGENTAKYTSLVNALNTAVSGDVIKLRDAAFITEDVAIKEGVTLQTETFALTVKEGKALTIDGTLYVNGGSLKVDLKNEGDKDGKVVLNNLIQSDAQIQADANYPAGAYYSVTEKTNTLYCVMPVAKAADIINDVDDATITLDGKLELADVAFTGTADKVATVIVDDEIKFGTITLDLAKIMFTNDKVAGSVSNVIGTIAMNGATGTDFAIISETEDDVKALIMSGAFTIADDEKENITVTGDVSISKFTVCCMTIDGNLTVIEDSSITDLLTINGTVNVANDKDLVLEEALVLGTLAAAEKTDDAGEGTITVDGLFVGIDEKAVTGASAAVSGKVVLKEIAFVAAGATVTESITDIETYTEYYVDGELWVTAYYVSSTYVIDTVKAPIENAYFECWEADGEDVGSNTIGSSKKVDAKINYNIYDVTIYAGEGIGTIAIDGVVMMNLMGNIHMMQNLTAGEHEVTYTLKNGYEGTAKLYMDGKEVSSMVLSGVNDDESNVEFTYTLSGATAIVDQPVIVEEDEGMALTDILLIVLVVLIVIMAIIVALRMMRS